MHIRKLLDLDSSKEANVDPREGDYVSDGVLSSSWTDNVVSVLESYVQNPPESFSVPGEALDGIWDGASFRHSQKASDARQRFSIIKIERWKDVLIRLTLRGANTSNLPRNPLLLHREVRVSFEMELLLWIKLSTEVRQDCSTLHDC